MSQNDAFVGLLNEFIIPAVNSDYAVIQEYGVRCLALVCVLDKVVCDVSFDCNGLTPV